MPQNLRKSLVFTLLICVTFLENLNFTSMNKSWKRFSKYVILSHEDHKIDFAFLQFAIQNVSILQGSTLCHRPIHVLLSRFHPDFIWFLFGFYPDFIRILSGFYSDFIWRKFGENLDKVSFKNIWIELGWNLDKIWIKCFSNSIQIFFKN